MNALLSTTYFGPVQWYQKLNRADMSYIECYDSYRKQTYRNRCIISTTNGLQALTIPVERPDGGLHSTLMKDLRISDHGNWRHLHWNALASAYGESPFFEYYEDDLHPFFEKKWKYLLDFNMEITCKMCELLDISPNIQLSEGYAHVEELTETATRDYRDTIRPKHPLPDDDFMPQPYYQVFRHKHGFLPNLSILDLLFNEGNEAVLIL